MYFDSSGSSASATTSRHSSSLGSPPPAPSGGGRQPKATLIHDSPPPPPPAPPPTGSPPSGAHFRPGAGNGTSGQPPISPTTATGPGRSFPPPPAALNILQPVASKRDSNSSLKGTTTPTTTDPTVAMSSSGSMPNTPSGRGVNRSASSTSFPLRIASFKGGSNTPSPAVVSPITLFNERLEGVVRDMTRANDESSASTSISSAKDVENSLLLDLLPRVSSPAEFPTVDMRSSIDTLYSSSDGSAPTQANFEKLKELTLRLYDMSRQFYLEMQQQQPQGMSGSDRPSILAGSGSGRSPRNGNKRPRIIQPPDVREASVASASGNPAMLNRVMSEVFTSSQGPGRAFNLPSTTSWLHKGKQLAHSASVASLGGYGGERRRTVARTKATRETDDFGIDHLAQYEIIAELGKGNYGSVCLALDEEGHSVAIKTMHRGNRLRTTVPSHALIPGPPSEQSSQSSQASESVGSNPMLDSSSNPSSPATIMVAAAGGEGEEQSRPLTMTGFTNPPAASGGNGEGEESMRNLSMTQVPAGLNGQVANWESSENSEEESADSIARSDPRKLSTPSSDSSGMGDVQRTNIFAQGQNPSAGALTIESTNSQSSQSLLLPSPSSRTGTTTNSTASDNPLGDKSLSKKGIRTTAATATNTTTNSTTTGKTVLTRSDTQQRLVNDLPLGCIEREIALMKRLRHKNVVQLFEVIDDEETETTHMVMQYVENGPIVKLKDDGTCQPLPIKEALDLMVQVSAGLDYLHRHGIAHRDIKPDNILIGKDKTAHLADFGVSGWLVNTQTGQRPTKAGAAVGTMAFQSPEVVRGDSIQFEKEADIWAYGVTLYLCLYGRLPFAGDTGPRIYKAILNEEVEFPEDGDDKLRAEGVHQHLIDSLKDLVVKLLKKKPEDRIKLREFRHHPVIEEILGKKTEDSAQNVTFKPPAMSRNVTQNENLDEMLQMLGDFEAGKKPPATSSPNSGTDVVPMPTFLVDSTPSSFSGNLKGGSNSLLGPGSPELGPKHTTHVFLGAGDSNNKSKMNLSSTQAPSTLPQAPDHLLWKQGESVDAFHGVEKVTSDSNMGSSGKRGGGGGGYDVSVPPALQQGKRASGSSTQSGASGVGGGLKSPTTSGGKTVSFDGAMDHRLSVISETSSSRRSSASNSVKDQTASPVIPPPVIVSSRPPLPFGTQAGGQTQQQQKTSSGSNHSLNSQKSSTAPSEATSTVSSENLAGLQKQHQPPGILQLNPTQGENPQSHNMQSPESEASSTQTRAWGDDSRSTPATTTTTGGADPSFSPDSTTHQAQNQQVLVGTGSSFNHPGDLQIPTFEMTDEDLLSAVSRRTVTLSRRVNTLTAQSNALVGGFVHKLRNKVNRRRVGTAGGSRRGGRPSTMGGSSINQQLDASGRGERPNSASHHRPSGDDVTDQKGTNDLVVAGSHIHLTKSPAVAGSLALHHHHHNNNTPSGTAPPISHQMSGGDFYHPEDDGPRPLSESFEEGTSNGGTIKSNNKTNTSRKESVTDKM